MSRIRGLALAGLLAGSLLVAGCATSPADKLSDDVPEAVKKPNAAQLMRLARRSLAASKSVHIEFTAGTGAHEKYIKMEGDSQRRRTHGEISLPGGTVEYIVVGDRAWVTGSGDAPAVMAVGGVAPRERWLRATPAATKLFSEWSVDKTVEDTLKDWPRVPRSRRVQEIFYDDGPAFRVMVRHGEPWVFSADGHWNVLQVGTITGPGRASLSRWNRVRTVQPPRAG